jgi:hypothetical protein
MSPTTATPAADADDRQQAGSLPGPGAAPTACHADGSRACPTEPSKAKAQHGQNDNSCSPTPGPRRRLHKGHPRHPRTEPTTTRRASSPQPEPDERRAGPAAPYATACAPRACRSTDEGNHPGDAAPAPTPRAAEWPSHPPGSRRAVAHHGGRCRPRPRRAPQARPSQATGSRSWTSNQAPCNPGGRTSSASPRTRRAPPGADDDRGTAAASSDEREIGRNHEPPGRRGPQRRQRPPP